MKQDKFYSEDELIQMYQSNEINLVTFIDLHSQEWQNEYLEFCSNKCDQIDFIGLIHLNQFIFAVKFILFHT